MSSFPRHLPPNIPTQFTQQGGGRCAPSVQLTQCNAPDNVFTQCIKADSALFQQITSNPMFALKKFPSRYWQLNNLPFNEMPPDALRLNAAGGLPLSSIVTAGDYYNVPLSQSTNSAGYPGYLVPAGYDGVINVTMNKFSATATGPDFQDASGALQWALGINNRLVVNYTNINIEPNIRCNEP